MRHMICVIVSHGETANLTTKIEDITVQELTRFNHNHAHIAGATYDWGYDSYLFYLVHNEFPAIPEGHCVPRYSLDAAERLYPYLFFDTNPLLYRKFGPVPKTYPPVRFFTDNNESI